MNYCHGSQYHSSPVVVTVPAFSLFAMKIVEFKSGIEYEGCKC